MSLPLTVKLEGETYSWDGRGWFNARNYTEPPQRLLPQLNAALAVREKEETPAGGPLRVLVSGARTWADREAIRRELAKLPAGSVVVHGDAKGADRLAGEVAVELGLTVLACPAEWHKYGRGAGLMRNKAMLAEHAPQLVLAFHPAIEEARGTKHMVELARKAGVKVRVVSGGEGA